MPVRIICEWDNADADVPLNNNILSIQNKAQFDSLDILFVGNSHCYAGINPLLFDEYNYKTFNLGIATAGPRFSRLLVQDYLKDVSVFPKEIFIQVSPISFSDKADNFEAYPIHRYLTHEISNEQLIAQIGDVDVYVSLLRKSFSKGIKNIFNGHQKRELLEFNSILRGHHPSNTICTDSVIRKREKLYFDLKEEEFRQARFDELINLAYYIQKKGIDVTFFELPSNVLSDFFNTSYLSNYEKSVVTLDSNFRLIRIKSELSMENYSDIDHLNSSGAEIATNEIISQISRDSWK